MKRIIQYKIVLICLWSFFLLMPQVLQAATSVGQVVFVKGDAKVSRKGSSEKKTLVFNDPIYPLDTLETQKGELRILLTDQTVLALGESSKLLITEYVYKPQNLQRRSIFDIFKGKVRTIIQKTKVGFKEDDVRLQTPTAVAGIRGTDVGIHVDGNKTNFICFQGAFEASFKGESNATVMVTTGMFTQINNAPPTPPAEIPPQLMQSFSTQLAPPPLGEVLDQPGSEQLKQGDGPPPPPPGSETPPPEGEDPYFKEGSEPGGLNDPSKGGEPVPPPPMPPAFIPGGKTETPPPPGSDAPSGGTTQPTTAPVNVPVTFPNGA